MPDQNAGTAYSQLITDQLTEERSRKTSLEARGVTVITTSSTLATLLFALTAGLTTAAGFKLPGPARLPLVLALCAFATAAALGLMTSVPLRYREPTPAGLAKLVDANFWIAPAEIGELRVASARVTTLAVARAANALKVRLLLGAISFELLAVIFLTWAVANVLYNT
jgi:hypothetical protein